MFYEVVFGSGPLGVAIWIGLFCVSTAALALVLILLFLLRQKNFLNPYFRKQITACDNADFGEIPANGSLFDNVLGVLMPNYDKTKSEQDEMIMDVIGRDSRKILRKIAALQTCANVAPMLGLLGTVQGMVAAFMGLGTNMGPEKASVLAVSISQALYTTAAGLVIAIPATILCIVFRNRLEALIDELNNDIEKLQATFSGEY